MMQHESKYINCKDSGVFWLGSVPAHWRIIRLKHTINSIKNGVWGGEPQGDSNDIYCIRVNDFIRSDSSVKVDDLTIRNIPQTQKLQYLLKKGNLLIEKSGGGERQPVGFVVLYNHNICAVYSNFIAKIKLAKNVVPEFAIYMHSAMYSVKLNIRSIKQTTGIQNLDTTSYFNEMTPLPPIYEQQAIANFLDHKTSEIDALINDKERLIELLKEQHQAIITEAVTKGLNPDVKMRDSGIEWIGEIPEHWNVTKIKYVAKIKYGLSQPPKEKEDGLPLIRATNIERGKINKSNLLYVDPTDIPYQRNPLLKQGDILVVRSGAYTADSALVTKEFEGSIAGYDMVLYDISMNSVMLSFILLSKYVLDDQLYLNKLRAAQPHLNAEELGETIIVLPIKLGEQRCIADSLSEKSEEINKAISDINMQIERLKEFRQSLIYEAVTGKVDVRNWVDKPLERSDAVANA